MDLTKLDTVAAANQGAWLHLRNPIDGSELYLDDEASNGTPALKQKPMRIHLLGDDADEIRQHKLTSASGRLQDVLSSGDASDRPVAQKLRDDNLQQATLKTQRFENILVEGEEWDASRALELYQRFPWIFEQVQSWTTERGNFMGKS